MSEPKDGLITQKRTLIRKVIAITVMLGCVATSAQATLVAKKLPSSINCGALPLGITASKHHTGSRKVQVEVLSGTQVVYRRKVTAARKWRKALPLPCGRTYVVVYRLSGGWKLSRTVKVQALPTSTSPTPTNTGGNLPAPDSVFTPQEVREFEQMENEEAAEEQAENEADEDNPFPDEPPPEE